MRTIFLLKDNFILYWDTVVLVAGLLLFAMLFYTFYVSAGGKRWVTLLYDLFAIPLMIVGSRFLYWLCHQEQFSGIGSAYQNLLSAGFCLSGAVLGTLLAAVLVRGLKATKKIPVLLDASGVSMAGAFTLFRFSALFNETCRGKISVQTEANQKLPLAATITNALGQKEYRFATFMVEGILFGILFILLTVIFVRTYFGKKKHPLKKRGYPYLMSLIMLPSVELILDSTRYDSCFMPFNGFVSNVQIFSLVAALVAMIILMVRVVKAQGCHFTTVLFMVLFVAALGGVGYTEYLIQRHGDWYVKCYTWMGICCVCLNILAFLMAGIRRNVEKI